MGLGDLWNPNLHPRGFHGRFIKKFKLAGWLDGALKNFNPRQFQSQGQANQFAFNQPKKIGHDLLATRRIKMDFDEAADHLRNGDIDDTTKKFMAAIDPHFEPAPHGGLILSRTFGPEALGLRPEQLNEDDPNGITGMMGNTLQDKMYSPTHLGQNTSHGPGKITMSIATPEGTPVAYSGTNPNDPGVYLNRDQKLLVTRVFPDGQGGWYISAVAEPPGATSGSPVAAVEGRKGAGLTPAQREARISGPSVFKQAAPPPSGDQLGHNLGVPSESTMPGPAQTPEQKAAAAPARAARKAAYQQARQAEEANGGIPQGATPPPQAPQPVTPTPAQNAPGVGARTEPVHGPIGGTPTEGKSASEIASTPPEPTPTPATPAAPQATNATFKQAFKDAGLQSPTAGAQRREFNNAYMGVTDGKKDPADALRELDADIAHNKHLLTGPEGKVPHEELRANVDKQQKLADLIATHFNEPRLHQQPELPHEAPQAPAAPAKKAFSTVKDLTPSERANYDSLDSLGRSRYLARRRAGQGHQSAFQNVKGGEKAPAKAAPGPKKGLTTAGQESPNALPPLHTAKAEAPAAPATPREKSPGTAEGKITTGRLRKGDKILVQKTDDGKWQPATKKTGATVLTVNKVERGMPETPGSVYRAARPTHKVHGTDENGNEITVTQGTGGRGRLMGHQTFMEHKEKTPRATKAAPAKAAENAVPAPAKASAAKVAKAAPAPKVVSEVQTRADEANLPKTVTALRQAAREKKIRGFSTMNKEQLQRALLGEEVSTGTGKLGPIAPDKLSGHIEAAATDQAARALMEDHTVADLKALAKHNGVDLKGITRKDAIKDAVIKHIRGEGPGALRPEMPKESLDDQIVHNKILAKGLSKEPDIGEIVDRVDENDPDSLRSHRDELEKIANDTKTSDPIRSRIAQEAADEMGMRAQRISGVEEAPTPVKAAKVAKKAAAPKLSVHQERVRKQALADGATEEEARAAGEAAPVRAPAGTKAAIAKATAARKAAGLPESRREQFLRTGEFNPGPQQTLPKRAPKAATPAKAGVPEGPGTAKPQGVREAAAPGDLLSPESTRKLRAAGMEPGVPGRGRIQSRDLKPGDRVMVERDSEGNLVPEMVRGDKAAFPVDVVKQNPDGSVQVKDDAGKLHNTVPEAPRGTSYRPQTPTEARRAAKKAAPSKGEEGAGPHGINVEKMAKEAGIPGDGGGIVTEAKADIARGNNPHVVAQRLRRQADDLPRVAEEGLKSFPAKDEHEANVRREAAKESQAKLHNLADKIDNAAPVHKVTKRGIPEADEAKFKAAGVKPNKVVPQGSVKGERAQTPIDNQFRAHEFDAAYMKHVDSRGNISDHAVESQDQVAADISEGRITPEEGIRRIESEISFNNDEIQQLSRDIRSGNLEGAQLDKARSDLNALERDNASHESLSRDLHQHFGKERVTTPEVLDGIKKENPGFWEGLNKETDTEGFRQEIAQGMRDKGFDPGTLKGDNAQEIFQDALAKTIKQGLEQRAAKVAKKPRAQKLWTPGATPEPHPDFAPGGPKHLDAKSIAEGLDISDADLKRIQANLDSGMTPGQAAKEIGVVTRRRRDGNVYINGTWGHVGKTEAVPGVLPETSPERIAGDKAKYDEEVRKADQLDELANRLKSARRPIVRKAAPAKAVENISQAEQATRSPAAKKALAEAKTQVQEAHDEMGKLRERITSRHQEAWNKSTSAKEAEAAAESMRKELTIGEIRDFFGKQGITGRSKDDIFKKAIERRFGNKGDISPEVVKTNAARDRVNTRMEESARLKKAGGGFANIDEVLANGGSERAVSHRVDTAGFSPEETARIKKAALSNDRAELDKIAQEHGLTRNTGAPGDIEPFEPGKHRAITGTHRRGDAVRVVQPGYQGTVEGRAFQAHPATVIAATPEEKQGMLDRLAQQKRDEIGNLTPEVRASVLARIHRQGQNPVAKKAAARARAAKGIAEPAPLPTNKAEEVAQNMARLNAAKAVKPSGDLKTMTKAELFKITEDEKIPVKKTSTKADLISSIDTWRNRPAEAVAGRGFEGNRPETGVATRPSALEATKARTAERAAKAVASKAGSGRMSNDDLVKQLRTVGSTEEANKLVALHMPRSRAQYQDLAKKAGVETGPNDSIEKMREAIVRHTATRRLEHAAYLRRANPVTATGAPEHGKLEGAGLARSVPAKAAPSAGEGAAVLAKGGFNEPFISGNAPTKAAAPAAPAALPTRGPIKRAHVRFDENTSPATFGREDGNQPLQPPNGRWSADQGLIHQDSEIGQLWSDLASDNRLPNSDLNKITTIGQDLARGKISTKQATTELNGIRNGLTDGPVKDRFTEAVRALDIKPTEYSVPDNTPKEVRDWLDRINAIPAFHDKAPNSPRGSRQTPFERAVALVRDIGEGRRESDTAMNLRNAANNVHESGDGVYDARVETDKVFFPSNVSSEVRNWMRTPPKSEAPEAPKAPAKATGLPSHEEAQSRARQAAAEPRKATKAAKKAAPAKVTQAELRNPVEKAGRAAPSATPSQVQASGLKAGEGIPTGPMLAARNKLGSGNAGTLTKLDTAVRIPARHSEIPGLLKDLQDQLQRAGVGPDDEPRKSLVAWFREHFK